jgi:hypothetical protein
LFLPFLKGSSGKVSFLLTDYFYVSEQIHELAVRKGISWLAREAKPCGGGWIAVMETGSIRFISRYRGLGLLKQLAKPPYKGDLYGLSLKLINPEKLPDNYENLVMLAIFPSDHFLDKLLNVPGASKILVVSWSRGDAERWIERSGAKLYSQPLDRRSAVGPT